MRRIHSFDLSCGVYTTLLFLIDLITPKERSQKPYKAKKAKKKKKKKVKMTGFGE